MNTEKSSKEREEDKGRAKSGGVILRYYRYYTSKELEEIVDLNPNKKGGITSRGQNVNL